VILLPYRYVVNSNQGLEGEITKVLLLKRLCAGKGVGTIKVDLSRSALELGAQKCGKYQQSFPVNTKEF
jgi:hypothetical protein